MKTICPNCKKEVSARKIFCAECNYCIYPQLIEKTKKELNNDLRNLSKKIKSKR